MRELGLLSVVAPVLNEEDVIEEFAARVGAAMKTVEGSWELILVDDGSSDRTPDLLAKLADADQRISVITLSRSFGHQAALTAGLDHARGDAVVMLDSDLQDPPELIPEMIERWREGSEVVYAVREERPGENRAKLATARWFYRVFARIGQVELVAQAADFRLLDRRALDALLAMRERNRFLRGMTVWVGFTQSAIPYRRDPRYAGETKFTMRRMLRFSLDAIASFSHVPLQAATVLGFTISAIAFLGIPIAIFIKATGGFVDGVTSVLLAVLLIGGIQLITVGVIGEYLGRVYDEVKQRPLYVVASNTQAGEGSVGATLGAGGDDLPASEAGGGAAPSRGDAGDSGRRPDRRAPSEGDGASTAP